MTSVLVALLVIDAFSYLTLSDGCSNETATGSQLTEETTGMRLSALLLVFEETQKCVCVSEPNKQHSRKATETPTFRRLHACNSPGTFTRCVTGNLCEENTDGSHTSCCETVLF